MQLPQFITRILGFAESSEKALSDIKASLASALAANEKADDALTDAQAQIKQRDDRIAALEKEKTDLVAAHEKALSDKEADVERRAGLKAQEITAKQGQPPIKEVSGDKIASIDSLREKLKATDDGAEKYRLAQEIKKLLGQN